MIANEYFVFARFKHTYIFAYTYAEDLHRGTTPTLVVTFAGHTSCGMSDVP